MRQPGPGQGPGRAGSAARLLRAGGPRRPRRRHGRAGPAYRDDRVPAPRPARRAARQRPAGHRRGHGGGAAAGDQVPEQGDELVLLGLGAQHGGEQGDLVEDDGDDGDAVTRADLAAAVGGQPFVPVVHDPLEPPEGDDGVVEVGADEFVGDVVPHAEFDPFAVEQHEPGPGGQGGVGGQGVHQPGFAAAGLARGEQVLVDDADVDGVAEFVDAHVDGVEHGQHRPDRDGARGKSGAGHGGFSFVGEAGNPRPVKAVGFPRGWGACRVARGRWRPGGRVTAPVTGL